jgi:glutathione synthase/RimK-type ligase-like ATP-grasp enzyme
MRVAVLVPDPGYPEPWRWTYDPQAEALTSAGAAVVPIPWTEVGDVSGYDLVLPLVAWGYHLDYSHWLALLDRAEAERWPMVNPPTLLRWNGDKAYLAELAERGVSTVPTLAVEACCDADVEEARRRFCSDWLVIKPPISASAAGTHRLGPNDDLPV